jgi:cysteine desulfurase
LPGHKQEFENGAAKRNRLQNLLLGKIPDLVVNGDMEHRLAGNLHISIPGILNSAVMARIRHQLAISTGSACSSGVETPSHVLQALGLAADRIESAFRIGIGKPTTKVEIDQAAEIIALAMHQVRQILCLRA